MDTKKAAEALRELGKCKIESLSKLQSLLEQQKEELRLIDQLLIERLDNASKPDFNKIADDSIIRSINKGLIENLECNTRNCKDDVEFFLIEQGCYPWETNSFICKNCMLRYIFNYSTDKIFSLERVTGDNVIRLMQIEKDNTYQPESTDQKAVVNDQK